MAEMYEFHVTGLIGPVVQAALPELTAEAEGRRSVLIGSTDEPAAVQDLLNRLDDHGLVADHIVIANRTRWQPGPAAPGSTAE